MPVETTASQSSSDFVGLWKKAASWSLFAGLRRQHLELKLAQAELTQVEAARARRQPPHLAREAEEGLGQVDREGVLLVRRPERGAAARRRARKRAGEHLVLGRHRRQHDVAHRPVLVDERLEERDALLRRRHRRVDEEAARLHRDHRHADRHVHVEDAEQLVKGPHLAGHRLAHQRLPLAVRRQRQRRPQIPVGGGRELRAR